MKMRTGFVSNSSSSSFIAIIPDRDFEDILKDLSCDISRKIIRDIVKDKTILGVPSKILYYFQDLDGFCNLNPENLNAELQEEIKNIPGWISHDMCEVILHYESNVEEHENGFLHRETANEETL